MKGAIIGDIIGSSFEWTQNKRKDFPLFNKYDEPTDDSMMTMAIMQAIVRNNHDIPTLGGDAIDCMRDMGRRYPHAGYGGQFSHWLRSEMPMPYGSFGNGAAMRVSPCGMAANSLDEARRMAAEVTGVTHDHPEGMKAAEAVACSVYLAKTGAGVEEIRRFIAKYYTIDYSLDEIRPSYRFDVSCQGSVPQALVALFEARDYEDAIRNAVSLGGDSDTQAAIIGGVAEYLWGIPEEIQNQGLSFLDEYQRGIVDNFYEYCNHEGRK